MYNPNQVEQKILKFWKDKKIFKKLMDKNSKSKKTFSFLDGPITANNPMGVHHAWGRTYKDLFQRFKAMQGYKQRFQNGFDCQGLWVEVEAEKDLKFKGKQDIERYGLEKFSKYCRERVYKYTKIQTEQSIKLGQWMDWGNDYYTMDDHNIESIWYFLKNCYDKKWLYKGKKVIPWCIRCGTSISQLELADAYHEISHTSVYIKLKIKDRDNEFLLVWTTTPWTLTSNTALAVNPELKYVKAKKGNIIFYLSKGTVNILGDDYKILDEFKGMELVGLRYKTPFDYLPAQKDVTHKVVAWKDVNEEEGTGIVHIAPGCGEEDYQLSMIENLAVISPLDESGNYVDGFKWLTGRNVKDITKDIINELERNGILFKTQQTIHRYPHCWRCREELVFRLVDEWFLKVDEIRALMKKAANDVEWYPEHCAKLMQDWLDNMQDWCISRKRYWGLPLPMWICEKCNNIEVISSKDELRKRTVSGFEQLKELHRPWIDNVKIKCSKCKGTATRINDTGDAWLDAGIVPFSTLNYFKDRKYWQEWFPAELVIEMREQIRLWFYSMLFMSVALVNKSPYKKVFAYEKVNDELGRPMHKSLGNAIWFDEAVEKMGADVMRWMYVKHNPSLNLNFGYKGAAEVKQTLNLLLNINKYINEAVGLYKLKKPKRYEIEDKWILSRLNIVIKDVSENLENLKPHLASKALEDFFVEDLSRTYIQFVRDRIQKDGKNKEAAIYVLYKLVGGNLIKLLAPFIPFLVEDIYLNYSKHKKFESIHLAEWPKVRERLIDKKLEESFEQLKLVLQLILAERENAKLGIRWPLAKVEIKVESPVKLMKLKEIIKKQANVKVVKISKGKLSVKLDTKLNKELEKEGYTREVTRRIQALRKKAGLNKNDLIILNIEGDYKLDNNEIKRICGVKEFGKEGRNKDKFKIREEDFEISLEKI